MKLKLEELFAVIDKIADKNLVFFAYEEDDIKLKVRMKESFDTLNGYSIQSYPTYSGNTSKQKEVEDSISAAEIDLEKEMKNSEGIASEIQSKAAEKEVYMTSPMVGTFYVAPAEGAEAFIQVGDYVKVGQVIGIVEAMKLMNEVEAEFSGIVEEILVKNQQVVEYGQPLVRLRVQ